MTEAEEKEILDIRDRLAGLEKYVKMGSKRVETFYREKPKIAMCMTLFAGVGIGFLLGIMCTCCKEECD